MRIALGPGDDVDAGLIMLAERMVKERRARLIQILILAVRYDADHDAFCAGSPAITDWPKGSRPGQNCSAILRLITIASGEFSRSRESNTRPASTRIPRVEK